VSISTCDGFVSFAIVLFFSYCSIIKISSSTTIPIPTTLGKLTSSKAYNLKNHAVLTCTPVPTIITNITLDFETLEIPWEPNTAYTIEVGAGFVKHQFGEAYGNPAFTINYTSNNNPSVVSFTPISVDGVTTLHSKSNKLIQLAYSNTPIIKNSGDIDLYLVNSSGPDTLLQTFTVPTDNRVTIDAIPNKVNINTIGLIKENSTYYLKVDNATFKDRDNFSSTVINDSTTVRFTTDEINFPGLSGTFTSAFATSVIGYRAKFAQATILSNTSLTGTGKILKVASANLTTNATVSANMSYKLILTYFG
jgi:hypothetical protein